MISLATATTSPPDARTGAPFGAAESGPAGAASLDERCRHAVLLDRVGRADAARAAFLDILATAPDHADTLNALGALLYRTGYRSAARTVFAQAVLTHPEQAAGRVNLANVLHQDGDLAASRHEFDEALRMAPDFAQAHQGYGDLLAALGEHEAAAVHWRLGYRGHEVHHWTYRGAGRPIRVLMPISVANGNIAARLLLDDQVFAVTTVAMEFADGAAVLPPHDLVLNAIGDADLCRPALLAAQRLLADLPAVPVINHPARVLLTGRADMARALCAMRGVVTPLMRCVPRAALLEATGPALLAQAGLAFPLLLRAPGFHTGRHFLRVEQPDDLAETARLLPGDEVLAIACLPSAWADGKVRKGRVMCIDGRLYPLHWAVSRNWKTHYFTADMPGHAAHRDEERRFLDNMAAFLGPGATAGLTAVAARLGLDYGGIDFGLSPDGDLLIFEANATMAIVPPPPAAIWDYRRPATDLALLAAQHMLLSRVTRQNN